MKYDKRRSLILDDEGNTLAYVDAMWNVDRDQLDEKLAALFNTPSVHSFVRWMAKMPCTGCSRTPASLCEGCYARSVLTLTSC